MAQYHIIVHYPDSYWGDDQIIFDVLDTVTEEDLQYAIMDAMEEIPQDPDASDLQDWADQVFDRALEIVGGGDWHYFATHFEVTIEWRED